ncbi:MAG TPA: SGNH/GDSL hydrolase family protein [Anaerolineales bacterium]
MLKKKRSNIRVILAVLSLGGFAAVVAACTGSPVKPEARSTSTLSSLLPTGPMDTPTSTATFPPSPSPTKISTPTASPSPTPDIRLVPYYWRDWPVTPELSPHALEILRLAAKDPELDLHAFSKVGDCQMTSATFLGGYANGIYAVPPGFEETVTWFSSSMTAESVTAANGLGISSVLDPLFGLAKGNTQCHASETPLDCELRTHHPAVVLIAMGTNWAPHGEASFELYLRTVVDRVLATGALPILATKADDIEGDWKLDLAVAQVAYDYDLPLVNVWRSVQNLPNHGLELPPKNEYLTGDGWMRRNYAWLTTLEKVRLELAK